MASSSPKAATAVDATSLKNSIEHHLKYSIGQDQAHASTTEWRRALSFALRDLVMEPWLESTRKAAEAKGKRVYYLSMEFLIGRLIEDVAVNLRVEDMAAEAMAALGQDYHRIVTDEPDAALGNGGLGRLAACFLDSLSTLGIPAFGYGIRYEHGLFVQHFDDGRQMETAETWLSKGHVWEIERPEVQHVIQFGGKVTMVDGKAQWHPAQSVIAAAYDTPVLGWKAEWANTLRLWAAKPVHIFDLDQFNHGKYLKASEQEQIARTISRVLYPDDTTKEGKELRLKQEYFFTAASIKDLIQRHLAEGHGIETLAEHVAIQLNDTHPAIGGPELVRLLVDEHGMDIDAAIPIARNCLGYTNHTLLPEALERWEESLFKKILPRHLAIIKFIEKDHVKRTGSPIRILRDHHVHMGELAFIMAHKVNGVSALHSDLVKKTVFADLHGTYPDRVINQTNGITPRRWLYSCNPPLRNLINQTIGTEWPDDLEQLQKLAPFAEDAAFRDAYAKAKNTNKAALCDWLAMRDGVVINPDAMFDVQIKRIHEYKRQLLNLLETVALWNAIRDNPKGEWTPRVKIFAGKAAPGYVVAKQIIHLINDVATVINADPQTKDLLQIVYPANYNVTMAEVLIPASDLSEQISTAGKEAAGTGNMKFALNGAPTIGTLDGANVEIRERVGAENFYLFGLTAEEVVARREVQDFARKAIEASPILTRVLGQIHDGVFSPRDKTFYHSLVQRMYEDDYFLVTCDFGDYYKTQRIIDGDYRDQTAWTRKAILNTANVGWFSSDRTIMGYAQDIWNVRPLKNG